MSDNCMKLKSKCVAPTSEEKQVMIRMVSHNVKGFVNTGQPLSYTSDMPDSDNNMIEMMRIDGTQVPRRLTEGLERG